MTAAETQGADTRCPICNAIMAHFTALNDGPKPRPGDVVLCSECATVLLFDAALRPQLPTHAEMRKLLRDRDNAREIAQAVAAIQARDEGAMYYHQCSLVARYVAAWVTDHEPPAFYLPPDDIGVIATLTPGLAKHVARNASARGLLAVLDTLGLLVGIHPTLLMLDAALVHLEMQSTVERIRLSHFGIHLGGGGLPGRPS